MATQRRWMGLMVIGAALAACDGQTRENSGPMGPDVLAAPAEVSQLTPASGLDGRPRSTLHDPTTTFALDVDTAAYANVRRFLEDGELPPPEAVRIEALVNYFSYTYPEPEDPMRPFTVVTEIGPTPWNSNTHLLHVGVKGYDVVYDARPAANLVFLIDVSGSMDAADKLPLVTRSLRMLLGDLGPDDTVALVAYGGGAGVVLAPTPGDETATITAALGRLEAGGMTRDRAGIEVAYALAQENFDDEKINRVILATDGDFDLGAGDRRELMKLIEGQREQGITLSALGFGKGTLDDVTLERLSHAGNGNAGYIDSLREARKVLGEELNSTLFSIAQDVSIEIAFNPAVVAEYRLIGYDSRRLSGQDFGDERIDAGDFGAGHSVTALYEVTMSGGGNPMDELGALRLSFKRAGDDTDAPIVQPMRVADVVADLDATSANYRFAAAVAGYGQLLRGRALGGGFTMADAVALADAARDEDPGGYRAEFLQLARLADSLGASVDLAGGGR